MKVIRNILRIFILEFFSSLHRISNLQRLIPWTLVEGLVFVVSREIVAILSDTSDRIIADRQLFRGKSFSIGEELAANSRVGFFSANY